MLHGNGTSSAATLVVLASLTGPHAAHAVGVTNPTAPHVYAVTYVSEEWTQAPGNGGLSGYLDNVEELVGTDAISSSQKAGTDSIPNPSCSGPCTAMTAEAAVRFVDGAVELTGYSHTYGNFDDVVVLGDPGSEFYTPGYESGDIVRAESNATMYDRLTITAPVQLDLQGHVSGNIGMTIASDSEVFGISGVDYGSGKADANVVISLISTPIQSTTLYPVSLILQGFDPSVPIDQDFAATTPTLSPGDYLLRAELRTATRIGNVVRPNLAVQDMHADFGHTATFRLVADVPEAVTSASGLLTFTAPEPEGATIGAAAMLALGIAARRRKEVRAAGEVCVRFAAVVVAAILAASPAAAYSISAQSIGAGGHQDATCSDAISCGSTPVEVEIGAVIADASDNQVDGHALTNGATGALGGYMRIDIANWLAAQSSNVTDFTIEKSWKSSIAEQIQDFVLNPGAPELFVRLSVSAADVSFLEPPPPELPNIDNGYARSHVWARLIYYNANPHVAGLDQVQVDGRTDRNLPADWVQVFGGDSAPPGYGSGSTGDTSAVVELHIPASEVDLDDSLLVSAQIYGEVRGGHWSGAYAASELLGGSMRLEMSGGDGAPQNPIFLSAPEPEGALLGGAAITAIGTMLRRRSR